MNYDWYTSWRHGFTICNCYAIQPGCTLEALLWCNISLQNLANLTLWLSIIIPKLLLWSRAPYKTKGEIKDLFSLCKSSLAYPILELHEIPSQNVHTTRSEILPSLSNFAQKPWCEWMRTIKTQESDARGTPAAPIPRPPICPTRSKEHFGV